MPAPIFVVIKSKIITNIFQNFLNNKDIRSFKRNIFYYAIFRIIRNFLDNDIIIKIYKFKVFGSIKKNFTSYFLLKKCEFGDYHELDTIERFSNYKKVFLVDCGCNYGFYSFHTASISKKNNVISIEASTQTSNEFLKNYKLNNFENITFLNKAISDRDNEELHFNESENDWESSLSHDHFNLKNVIKIKTIKIDTLLQTYKLDDYFLFIKLDIEGHEMNAIEGALSTIKNFSPIIIIEFSKYIFDDNKNINFLKEFLKNYDYHIYDTRKNKVELDNILESVYKLTKRYKTIGNYYLIKNSSNNLKLFKND